VKTWPQAWTILCQDISLAPVIETIFSLVAGVVTNQKQALAWKNGTVSKIFLLKLG